MKSLDSQPTNLVIFVALVLYSLCTLTSMAVMSIGVGILFAVTVWLVARRTNSATFGNIVRTSQTQDPQITHFFRVSCLLTFACFTSLFIAKLYPLQFAGKGVRVEILPDTLKAWYLFFPFWLLVLFGQVSENNHQRLIRLWLLAAGVLSVVAVVQFYTGFPRPQRIPTLSGRFHATLFFGHHLSTASILIFPFFVALSFAASKLKDRQTWSRYFFALIASLIGVALFLTWSRMLWIALPVGIFVFGVRRLQKTQLVVAGITIFLLGWGITKLPAVHDRMTNLMGTQERVELWKANWNFFEQRPILGVGWRKAQSLTGYYFEEKYPGNWSHRFVGHAHNNLLEMLSGVGAIGTLLWLYWNFLVFRMALRVSRRTDFFGDVGWGLFCAWIVLHLNGLTQVNFWEGKVLHQMMWATGLLLLCSGAPLMKTEFARINGVKC